MKTPLAFQLLILLQRFPREPFVAAVSQPTRQGAEQCRYPELWFAASLQMILSAKVQTGPSRPVLFHYIRIAAYSSHTQGLAL